MDGEIWPMEFRVEEDGCISRRWVGDGLPAAMASFTRLRCPYKGMDPCHITCVAADIDSPTRCRLSTDNGRPLNT